MRKFSLTLCLFLLWSQSFSKNGSSTIKWTTYQSTQGSFSVETPYPLFLDPKEKNWWSPGTGCPVCVDFNLTIVATAIQENEPKTLEQLSEVHFEALKRLMKKKSGFLEEKAKSVVCHGVPGIIKESKQRSPDGVPFVLKTLTVIKGDFYWCVVIIYTDNPKWSEMADRAIGSFKIQIGKFG
jgi:hypothetical protein